jgi:thioesterase domain-containing protein
MHELDAFFARHVPLVGAMGVRLRYFDASGLALAAPLTPNINDKGTAFGGALAAIITLSCWSLTYLLLREQSRHVDLVVSDSSLKFLRPVRGEIIAVCPMPEQARVRRFIDDFKIRGKARWDLHATIDGDGEPAVRFQGRFVALRPESS